MGAVASNRGKLTRRVFFLKMAGYISMFVPEVYFISFAHSLRKARQPLLPSLPKGGGCTSQPPPRPQAHCLKGSIDDLVSPPFGLPASAGTFPSATGRAPLVPFSQGHTYIGDHMSRVFQSLMPYLWGRRT